jgi:hypothetical protein
MLVAGGRLGLELVEDEVGEDLEGLVGDLAERDLGRRHDVALRRSESRAWNWTMSAGRQYQRTPYRSALSRMPRTPDVIHRTSVARGGAGTRRLAAHRAAARPAGIRQRRCLSMSATITTSAAATVATDET